KKHNNASDHIKASWNYDGKEISALGTFTFDFVNAGAYVFTGHFIDTLTSCVNIGNFIVNAFPNPKADFGYEPLNPVEETEIVFSNNSQGEALEKFSWHFVDNEGFTSDQKNTSHAFPLPGEYPVVLVVSDANNCTDSVIKIIKVEEDFSFYVPNAFTPNDDDLNEMFMPVTRGVTSCDMQIFNRWGQMVFSTTELGKGWDGTFRGQIAKQDSYVWQAKIVTNRGEKRSYSGSVTLLRME
ncbi:MAG: gliding motility-associated C-terminal domain-containing protein, partial [Bacteroidia bacterium]|nr:gliding motility-associated C-terminal domain-containing protein [Bacteroidia bacterium]